MKYENARDVLPEALIREIQKYVSGKLLYIPSREKKREWGTSSGYRQYLQDRNREIRERFAAGESLDGLAECYSLSGESIRRIVYNRRENMTYSGTLTSAQEWAHQGRLEEWVHAYLVSDGHNPVFSEGLKLVDRIFLGPVSWPLRLLHRCCGPEEDMRWRIPEAGWEQKLKDIQQAILAGTELPPLIVHYLIEAGQKEGEFELNDGNHRWEAYQRLGIEKVPAIFWITDRDEYEQFLELYGSYLP